MNKYTIILAHGIARFDFLIQRFSRDLGSLGLGLGLANNELHYFKDIARYLRNHGFNVYQSSVSFASGVEHRAADLKREVETALTLFPEHSKVHIIGHSMGGLDARHMIVNHGMADKVASLTTIGTPHMGTSFADWGMINQGHKLIEIMGNIIDLGGFADLTTAECNAFNNSAEASEAGNDVFYQTYGSSESLKKVFAPLQSSWKIINEAQGDNDGLVPHSSQLWRTELTDGNQAHKAIEQHNFPVSADHLNEVGWWDINQLEFSDLFLSNPLEIVSNYEKSIKDVYLEIARRVQQLS